jgi:hypothetical protein
VALRKAGGFGGSLGRPEAAAVAVTAPQHCYCRRIEVPDQRVGVVSLDENIVEPVEQTHALWGHAEVSRLSLKGC